SLPPTSVLLTLPTRSTKLFLMAISIKEFIEKLVSSSKTISSSFLASLEATCIAENRWSRYFIICAVLQAICVCTIQYLILEANDADTRSIAALNTEILERIIMSSSDVGNNFTNLDPMKTIVERGERLVIENAFIISFDVFLCILCFDVVYHCDHIELVTVLLINFLMAGYAVTEIIENNIFISRVMSAAADYNIYTQIGFKTREYSIAHVSILVFFVSVFTYFGYKLYREFEWHGFHQTGADSKFQVMYRNYSVFNLLVKLDFFFVWGFGIFYTYESYLNWDKLEDANPTATTIYLTVLVVLFPIIATLGFLAVQKENILLMSIFLVYFSVVPVVFILGMIQTPIKPWAQFNNQIFTCGLMILATFIYGILVFRAFKKGFGQQLSMTIRSYASSSISRRDTPRFTFEDGSDDENGHDHRRGIGEIEKTRRVRQKRSRRINKIDLDLSGSIKNNVNNNNDNSKRINSVLDLEKGYQPNKIEKSHEPITTRRTQIISLSRSQTPLRREEEDEITLTTPQTSANSIQEQGEPPKKDSSETIVERMQWERKQVPLVDVNTKEFQANASSSGSQAHSSRSTLSSTEQQQRIQEIQNLDTRSFMRYLLEEIQGGLVKGELNSQPLSIINALGDITKALSDSLEQEKHKVKEVPISGINNGNENIDSREAFTHPRTYEFSKRKVRHAHRGRYFNVTKKAAKKLSERMKQWEGCEGSLQFYE
ncbi:14304_t:CDS:10, partial [Ambispora leptoticha]